MDGRQMDRCTGRQAGLEDREEQGIRLPFVTGTIV